MGGYKGWLLTGLNSLLASRENLYQLVQILSCSKGANVPSAIFIHFFLPNLNFFESQLSQKNTSVCMKCDTILQLFVLLIILFVVVSEVSILSISFVNISLDLTFLVCVIIVKQQKHSVIMSVRKK